MNFKGLSQKEFCLATEYSETNLSNFLTGKTQSPRIDLLEAIAVHYPDISISWILTGKGKMIKGEGGAEGQKGNEPEKLPNKEDRELALRLLARHVQNLARDIKERDKQRYEELNLDGLLEDLKDYINRSGS